MQSLIDYIEQIVKLDEEAIEALHRLAEVEHYKKNQYILEPGQLCHKIWFLQKGLVRKFYLHDGEEITTWIHAENETFTSMPAYAQGKPSEEFLQACEDTVAIGISRQNSEKLAQYPAFLIFTNVMMQRVFVNLDVHTKVLNSKDARGKYEYLKIIAPELVRRAKLGHIASILGISPETLSRIRRG